MNSSKREISEETRAKEKGKMRTFVVPRYNNVNCEFFVVACPVWRLVHIRFEISNKEFAIMSIKGVSVQLELNYIEKQNLKI